MNEPNELTGRVDALEDQMRDVRSRLSSVSADATAARALAAGADRDVAEVRAELRAHTSALNAMRETQLEQGQQITDLRTELRDGFTELRTELRSEMRDGFAKVGTGMAQITALLHLATDTPTDDAD